MAEPSTAAVERLAGCITDGPVGPEHRALARAQLLSAASPPAPLGPPPPRAAALALLRATGSSLQLPVRELSALATAVGPALAARLTAITGQLETAGFDLATLVLDLQQGNYRLSLGEAAPGAAP